MRHGNKVKNLSRSKDQRNSLVLAQLKSLFENKKLETTRAKAKVVKQMADRVLYTLVSKDGEEFENTLEKTLKTKSMHEYLLNELKPMLDKTKTGGFTRIFKVENRKGDNAEMSLLVLSLEKKSKDKSKSKNKRSKK